MVLHKRAFPQLEGPTVFTPTLVLPASDRPHPSSAAKSPASSAPLIRTLVRIHRWTRMEGVRTAEEGEGVAGAMIRARIRVDGRLAGGRRRFWGRRWRSAVAVLSEMAG